MNDGIGGGIHDACRILAQRPDVRIATGSVTARLRPELAALSLDLPVRPMQSCRLEAVFTGNGRMFCAGGCRAECFDSCVNTGVESAAPNRARRSQVLPGCAGAGPRAACIGTGLPRGPTNKVAWTRRGRRDLWWTCSAGSGNSADKGAVRWSRRERGSFRLCRVHRRVQRSPLPAK